MDQDLASHVTGNKIKRHFHYVGKKCYTICKVALFITINLRGYRESLDARVTWVNTIYFANL